MGSEAWIKCASRWTRTGYKALASDERATYGFPAGRSGSSSRGNRRSGISPKVITLGALILIPGEVFRRINHDKLMASDRQTSRGQARLLKLIRAFLNAGVMEKRVGPAQASPQGGPLSPLLSNFVLDELDRKLKRRGHRFTSIWRMTATSTFAARHFCGVWPPRALLNSSSRMPARVRVRIAHRPAQQTASPEKASVPAVDGNLRDAG